MTNKTQTFELTVMRDGQLDQDYYDALERAERQERMLGLGKSLLHGIGTATIVTAGFIGRNILECYAAVYDEMNGTQTRGELWVEVGKS